MKAENFNSCLDVPCIFCEDWIYQAIPSRYLRQRQILGTPISKKEGNNKKVPTPISMKNYAYWLCNFLEWVIAGKKNWRKLKFVEDILFGYQADMCSGVWSSKGRPLAARTVNNRVGVACDYLSWAAAAGLRGAFKTGTHSVPVKHDSASQTSISDTWATDARDGSVRIPPSFLRMPTDEEVRIWIASVEQRWGYVKTLMCRLIIASAIRREECVQWQVDTVPINKADWNILGGLVSIEICYGTKGSKVVLEDGHTIGPSRIIFIPLELAEEIDEYRKIKRVMLQAKFVRSGKTHSEKMERKNAASSNLFLSEHTGGPISAQTLYNAWTDVSEMPFMGWHPHLGRHFWVCKKLIMRCFTMTDDGKLKYTNANRDFATLKSSVQDVLALEVKPQLGHVSEKSAESYLRWMQQLVNLPEIYDKYQDSLNNIIA